MNSQERLEMYRRIAKIANETRGHNGPVLTGEDVERVLQARREEYFDRKEGDDNE